MKHHADPIHLTFLGCGRVARAHSGTLSAIRAPVRCAYASRDPARARAYAERHGGRWLGSYDDALDDERADAVLVATPPATHLDLTLRALRAGKHVIVEKPPFLRAADVADVRAAAARAGRLVLVAENYFYKPLAVRLRELLGAGAVGDVLFVHVNAVKRQAGDGWRADTRLAGGGALFEGGIHWVNLLANLGLTPQKVRAFRPGAPEDPACERSMMLAIEYAEGAVGTLLYSWEVPSPLRGLRVSRIFGRRGAIAFESNGLAILVSGAGTRLILPGLGDIGGYKAMFRDFIGAIRAGREPRMTLDLAERDLALVEAAYRSIGSG